jgi:hypothetical protein
MNWFIGLVKIVVLLIVLVMWTVFGFLLWIPFLTRMMLVFMAAVVTSIYTNKDPSFAKQGLESGITFYSRGFQTIFSSMGNSVDRQQFVREDINVRRVLLEVVFAIIFWMGITSGWWLSVKWGSVKLSELSFPAMISAAEKGEVKPESLVEVKVDSEVQQRDQVEAARSPEGRAVQRGWCGTHVMDCKMTMPVLFREWCALPENAANFDDCRFDIGSREQERRKEKELAWCHSNSQYCRHNKYELFVELCKKNVYASVHGCP